MKKILLILTFVFSTGLMYSQNGCSPDPQFIAAGIYPDSATGLSNAFVGQAYSENITIVTPVDTFADVFGTMLLVNIDNIDLTSVTGLPPNFDYTCDPPNCSFPGGTSKCAELYSTSNPTIADIGLYPLVFETTTYISGIPIIGTTTQNDVIDYYYIEITYASTWDCDGQGNCIDPGTGNGQYPNQSFCQQNCIAPSWDCDGQGNCIDPGTGLGTYDTLSACQIACVLPTWECVQNTCIDPLTGQGSYPSLSACISNCAVTETWDCNPLTGNCSDPGTGIGMYPDSNTCQTACVLATWDCDGQGNCTDPGTGIGMYPDFNTCQTACMISAVVHQFNAFTFQMQDIYPNPVNNQSKIQFITGESKDVVFSVFNYLGEKMNEQIIAANRGVNDILINANNYPNGIYLYSINNGKKIIAKRMLVAN